jgi:hypothetical protein
MEFLAWLEGTEISQWVQASDWGYPIILCLHSVGMGLVVGLILVLNLRVLGYAKAIPLSSFQGLLTVAWLGFAVNAGSGMLLFMANATRLIANWTFQLKLALIVLGGLCIWSLWRLLKRNADIFRGTGATTGRMKVQAVITILLWLGAITSGRYIAYVLDAQMKASLQ